VHLNLGDSLSREAGFLSLRLDIWNAIERPLRDRRLFDYANHCFFFGYQAVDTVQVGGETAEIRIREVPCYPYLQRRVASGASPTGSAPVPGPVSPAPAEDSSRRRVPPLPRAP
jgi:hypothetical protein